MYKIDDDGAAPLKAEPESGVGFQLLRARVAYKAPREYVVLNAELFIPVAELEDLQVSDYADLLKEAKAVQEVSAIELLKIPNDWSPASAQEFANAPDPFDPLSTARMAPHPRVDRKTYDYEGFVRFSAYSADRRIKPDGSVLKGTFASTVADFKVVPSGFAAVGRYALPNPAAASFVYMIVPGAGWRIVGGTVRPSFAQAGGGVEVVFTKGAPAGSAFTRPFLIPQM